MPTQGYLSLVLHAHLPYVRHPEHRDFLEEDWLFEAMTETYIPLLRMMHRLWDDGILDPVDTRKIVGMGIAMSLNNPFPDQKFGVFRM